MHQGRAPRFSDTFWEEWEASDKMMNPLLKERAEEMRAEMEADLAGMVEEKREDTEADIDKLRELIKVMDNTNAAYVKTVAGREGQRCYRKIADVERQRRQQKIEEMTTTVELAKKYGQPDRARKLPYKLIEFLASGWWEERPSALPAAGADEELAAPAGAMMRLTKEAIEKHLRCDLLCTCCHRRYSQRRADIVHDAQSSSSR